MSLAAVATTTITTATKQQQGNNGGMKNVIVLLDPVTEWKPVVQAAIRLEYIVVAVQLSPISDQMIAFHPTESLLQQAGVHSLLDLQNRDVFSCVQALQLWLLKQQQQQQPRIGAVIPLSETAVDYSDTIAACLGLQNHNPLDLVLCKRDKGFMKEVVATKHGGGALKVAKFARLWNNNAEELDSAVAALGLEYPIVIKNPQGFSTTDVYVCSNKSIAHDALTKILSLDSDDHDSDRNKGPDGRIPPCALLEEYIDGTEFAVNLLGTTTTVTGPNSIGTTTTTSSSSPPEPLVTDVWMYNKESTTARYNSASLCNHHDQEFDIICDYAKRVAKAVGIHYGAAHVELKATRRRRRRRRSRLDDEKEEEDSDNNDDDADDDDSLYSYYYDNPILMEVGARLSGGRKATMMKEAYAGAFDPFQALIQSHLGDPLTMTTTTSTTSTLELPPPSFHVKHLFLPVEESGRIRKIHSPLYDDDSNNNNQNNHNLQTLHSHFWLIKEGDVVKKTTDITSCAGFVWLVGEKDVVEKESQYIRTNFRIEMEES